MSVASPLQDEHTLAAQLGAIAARAPKPHPAGAWAAVRRRGGDATDVIARFHQRDDVRLFIRLEDERRRLCGEQPCRWKVERVDEAVSGRTPLRRLNALMMSSADAPAAPESAFDTISNQIDVVAESARAAFDAVPPPSLVVVRRAAEIGPEERRLVWAREWVRCVLVGRNVVVERCRRDALGGDSWSAVEELEQVAEILRRAVVDMADEQGARG
jgi:hypothetical protein